MRKNIPKELRDAELHMKGKDDIFIGRAEQLERRIESALRRETVTKQGRRISQTSGAATVITGAPGAGKSSLLGAITESLEAEGIGVVAMEATKLRSKESFGEHMAAAGLEVAAERASEIWQSRWQNVEQWASGKHDTHDNRITRLTMRHVAGIAKLMGKTGLKFVTKQLQNAWELVGKGQRDPFRTLRLMDAAFPQGWLLCIDEVERIAGMRPDDFPTELITSLSNRDARAQSQLAHGNLIMAGLSDSLDVLEDLDITRIQQDTLGGLTVEESARVISKHMDRGRETGNAEAVPHRADWIRELSERYHVWAHHTKAAAWAAEWVAAHAPENPNGLAWVHEKAQLEIEKLYNNRVSRAEGTVPREVIWAIMRQYQINSNTMTYTQLQQTLIRARKTAGFEMVTEHSITALARMILHSGLMDKDEHGNMSVPIPSLMAHCLDTLPQAPDLLATPPTKPRSPKQSKKATRGRGKSRPNARPKSDAKS